MWFEKLMGFEEVSPIDVREKISVEGEFLYSKINGKKYKFGKLEVPTLEELRKRISLKDFDGKIQIDEVVGNVANFHQNPLNNNAVFQAASQFNMLEMISPAVTPEQGVDRYENDRTQGPACAISCGAGTVYRNYFADVNGKIGQTAKNRIDGLELIGDALNNQSNNLWRMQNGYAMFSDEGLDLINRKLFQMSDDDLENLKGKLKVGVQWETEVTTANSQQVVTQVYCSALPIGYHSYINKSSFQNFAKLILEALYDATFFAAAENFQKTGCAKLFLTLVGGGVFGNETDWIIDAISNSSKKFSNVPLDVKIVSYGFSNPAVSDFVKNFR